jgi:hypothetical protein
MRFVHNGCDVDTATDRMSIITCRLRENLITLTLSLTVKCGAGGDLFRRKSSTVLLVREL